MNILEFSEFIIGSFPILILIVIMIGGLLVVFTRKISDMDDIEEAEHNLEMTMRDIEKTHEEITALKIGRHRYGNQKNIEKVVRGLGVGRFDPSILIEKPNKILNPEEQFPCSNCGSSVMAHWEKCYHCGNEI